jgi:hypothetical protein
VDRVVVVLTCQVTEQALWDKVTVAEELVVFADQATPAEAVVEEQVAQALLVRVHRDMPGTVARGLT